MAGGAAGKAFLSRPNIVVLGALTVLSVTAWAWVLAGAGMDRDMTGMSVAAMAALPPSWTLSYAALMVFMWITMMIAMMAPSATPAALLYGTMDQKRRERGLTATGPAPFMAGYLAVWSAFSLVATLAQWGLERLGLVGMGMSSAAALSGALCVAAGLYQFANIKNACLSHCQNPLFYFSEHWRPGVKGAFLMGVAHGGFCLGCCWVLMALLFVGGVMNPLWIAGIALYVALEKLAPHGRWLGRVAGAALIATGVLTLSGVIP